MLYYKKYNHVIRNAVKDDLLRFLSTSRDSLTRDSTMLDVVAF